MPNFGFSAKRRIRSSREFDFILKHGVRRSTGYFNFFTIQTNHTELSRLGMMIGKRYCPKAVHRNQIRRFIREWFRQKQLSGVDLVVLLKSPVTHISVSGIKQCLSEY